MSRAEPQRIADPYEELGVAPHATEREIRAAYRRLAAQWHPDRNDSPRAPARMARINRAYQQLFGGGAVTAPPEDADAPPEAPEAPEAPEPPARASRSWWERDWGIPRWEADGTKAPQPILHTAPVSLEDAATGCTYPLQGSVADLCETCHGSGRLVSHRTDCRACNGEGRLRAPRNGRWTVCTACGGDGADRKPCGDCTGSGLKPVPRRYHYEVRLPVGVREGQTVRLRGQGQRGIDGAAGDIELRVALKPHPVFAFDGDGRLVCRVPVDGYRAAADGTAEVPTLGGAFVTVELSRGPVQVLDGHGWPRRDGARGPLVVETRTVVPERHDATQRALLRALSDELRRTGYAGSPELAAWQRSLDAWRHGGGAAEDDRA